VSRIKIFAKDGSRFKVSAGRTPVYSKSRLIPLCRCRKPPQPGPLYRNFHVDTMIGVQSQVRRGSWTLFKAPHRDGAAASSSPRVLTRKSGRILTPSHIWYLSKRHFPLCLYIHLTPCCTGILFIGNRCRSRPVYKTQASQRYPSSRTFPLSPYYCSTIILLHTFFCFHVGCQRVRVR
jgi:hypothetical protein